ncbi:MAG: pyridoxamine 5'-phosphate oxidase family protein [Methylomonas sp.]|jgi:predicted pyridoxine 5'-phosphate oxidase superfamily flavin-nucleotide-binding protein
MNEIYGEQHRALQKSFDTVQLADRIKELIVLPEIPENHKNFIESRDMFFFTTVDHRGYPTCSYKGGTPGFVKVLDASTIAFPSYDGNGMFLSMGNIAANDKVGMLFIDFETPHRLRVHGVARVDKNDALIESFIGAELVVRVAVTEIFVNCPRYIHQYQRLKTSKYAPGTGNETPQPPQWKRIDAVQDALPAREKDIAGRLGGTITPEQYGELLMKGEG